MSLLDMIMQAISPPEPVRVDRPPMANIQIFSTGTRAKRSSGSRS